MKKHASRFCLKEKSTGNAGVAKSFSFKYSVTIVRGLFFRNTYKKNSFGNHYRRARLFLSA